MAAWAMAFAKCRLVEEFVVVRHGDIADVHDVTVLRPVLMEVVATPSLFRQDSSCQP